MIAIKIGTTSWRATETLAADEIEFAGQFLYEADGFTPAMVWDAALNNVRPRTEAETLARSKEKSIAGNRAECSRRIYARYPAGRQSSVALGIYSGPEAEAQAQTMKDWISDMVAAENTAADAIEAATTVQAVEAVTVAWPV